MSSSVWSTPATPSSPSPTCNRPRDGWASDNTPTITSTASCSPDCSTSTTPTGPSTCRPARLSTSSPANGSAIPPRRPARGCPLCLAGLLHVDHSDGAFDVQAGQALDIEPGEWVRYSPPEPAGADYVTVCIPAFSRAEVHRDASAGPGCI